MVYWQIEPFGSPVDDHRSEQLLSLLFQANTPANTRTPQFFDRRLPEEVERDAWLEKARTVEALPQRVASFFDRRIAKQAMEKATSE